ncbi:glycosyltransferase family 4 protein [Aurantiacibacter aquimixticola]|uniref:Glycosyltransferase n=1 Tax=Aurantiacibacter aquimixticola TaxID=1958945 RepID=A0A419RSF3_9SPHN|nr:glycosyltransferase family 4 protein [Aurantiacibacter aquimixticola]RJY08733.1 glycosyltransferase [Aurantiacibacter aquimixticola]
MTQHDRPKTAIVVATESLSGAQNRAIKIYRALKNDGYPVELWLNPALKRLIAADYPAEADDAIEYRAGGPIHRLLRPLQRSKRLWAMLENSGLPALVGEPRFERLATQRGIELAHIFLDLQIGHVRNLPTIFELTSPDIADTMGSQPLARRRSHTLYHAVSPSVARRFSALSPNTSMVEANGPFFSRRVEPITVIKENTVVFAHRFIPRKNAVLFARVARRFVDRRPDWRVQILGRGSMEEEVRSAIKGVADKVEVAFTSDLAAALSQSRVFVSLIQPDNYPSQSVLEAMSLGNALLLSDTGDSVSKFLGGNGVATDLNEDAILHNLLELVSDEAELDRMADRSRELVDERFSARAYLDHLRSLYATTVEIGS